MNEIKLDPNSISDFLTNHIKENKTVFVFSTDTVMNSWVEYLIIHPEITGVDALPLERFVAWDNFKRSYLNKEQTEKKSVPSVLRKLFVLDLIKKNAELPKDQRFQVIINPQDEYAGGAASFSDWICKNLPSLHYWKQRIENNKAEYGELDAEDKDYLKLYELYDNFLQKNNLFEPAWLDNLTFEDKETHFVIFYPELHEDFNDYKNILGNCQNITVVTIPETIPSPAVYKYADSRSELRQTMLRIIQLINDGKADWSEIALSIPNIDVYRPYIEREFDLYEIPYVIKSGLPLTQNSAGKIFNEISDCYNENFSFDTVRALILDECVPWKKENEKLREDLVRVGNEMRCICSPTEKDIWLSAFQSKINRVKDDEEKLKYYSDLKDFYGKINFHVTSFFKAETFEEVNESWQQFKFFFLESDKEFSKMANAILGRCISELKELIQIQKDFSDSGITISNPFEFFLSEIQKKKYTPKQENKTGVNVFPYKLSGPAFFKYQFVIDSSQKNLEVPYKRLAFLNATKRAKLHLIEDDKKVKASEVFTKLYAKNCGAENQQVVFSYAEQTFSGYAIPHNSLVEIKNASSLDESDFIKTTHDFILSSGEKPSPLAITNSQKEQFNRWSEINSEEEETGYKINEKLLENLKTVLVEKRNTNTQSDEKIKITSKADLDKFFPCPRKWILSSILKLKDDTLDTSLMQSFDMGNLNHKLLELFISQFKGKTLPYYDQNTENFMLKNEGEINSTGTVYYPDVVSLVDKAILSLDFKDSPLVVKSLSDQKEKIAATITDFLKYFLKPYGPEQIKGGFRMAGVGNCRVVDCEKTTLTPGENFDYYGKIDCLLLTPSPENDWLVIDYKNSSNAMPDAKNITADKNNILLDFQMPLYFTLIDREEKHTIAAGFFYSIKDSERRKVVDTLSEKTEKDENGKAPKNPVYVQDSTFQMFNDTMTVLDEYCELFYERVNPENKLFDFSPASSTSEKDRLNVKSFTDCKKCNFKSICRTTYNMGGKNIHGGKNE